MTHVTNWKPSRMARKAVERQEKRDLETKEKNEKAAVRRRDRTCRFPLCGCKRAGYRLEASHDFHKGNNSNARKEAVSIASLMILLCFPRHQDSAISRHKRTLRTRYLTPDHNDGPVAWEADLETLERVLERKLVQARRAANTATGFVELARERDVQQLEPLEDWQRGILEQLAEMAV